jgi:hypothetical protein
MRRAAARLPRRARVPRRSGVSDARALFTTRGRFAWASPSNAWRALSRLDVPMCDIVCEYGEPDWKYAVATSMCFSGSLTLLRLSSRLDSGGLLGLTNPNGVWHEMPIMYTWLGCGVHLDWWAQFATPRRLARYVAARYTGEGFGSMYAVAAQFAEHFAGKPRALHHRVLFDVFRRLEQNSAFGTSARAVI